MAQINMESILSKANAYINTPQFQKKIEEKVDSIAMTGGSAINGQSGRRITIAAVPMAAAKFIEVLQNEIGSLSIGAGEELTKLEHGAAHKIGKNKYQIEVWFSGDLHRDSLYPAGYPEGVNNIAALFNNGYGANDYVYGEWHGERIRSKKERNALNFIGNAVQNYMANYASEYGVIDIDVADIYK